MSFILDALKKSESDRQRQSGPALFEVKVAPPKSRFPVWAIAIAALLVVNMIIVGWMLLRRSSRGEETTATNNPPASTSATAPAAGAAVPPSVNNTSAPASPSVGPAAPPTVPPINTAQPNTAPSNTAPSNTAPSSSAPPPGSTSPTSGPAPALAQGQSSSSQQGMGAAQPRMLESDRKEPTLAGNAREARDANTEPAANPDDYAPAADPGALLFKGHVRRGTESGLVLYQDAALTPGANLPQLRLDLHVYAAKPQDRFALINMHKMHEGDSLQDGVRVEAITPDGVVMSHNGSKFLLPRE
jgi:general secretion pathway protein B